MSDAKLITSTGDHIPISLEQERQIVRLLGDPELVMRVAHAIYEVECSRDSQMGGLDEEEILSAYWDQAEAAIACMPHVILPEPPPADFEIRG